ncbi:AbrB/MazE/SpoVT family DNA-binding domain-containing protein [Haladaptatus sp. DYSN1]|uniref:AbrB/MazE/SpoVT family DNA-binding domain-containing protein n=1 Tax=unclassified Haladaptatus TaxID=2622732 RepID=UPI0024064237|nr:AbrB/MazE/SpoVT family DNA-binding domain-containing protein [Haladaptatus sp. DYSN1]
MSRDRVDAESTVSGGQANIPGRIRRELGINDGDRLWWHVESDGSVSIEVVQQRTGTFANFNGYNGAEETDGTSEHDAWGVNVE